MHNPSTSNHNLLTYFKHLRARLCYDKLATSHVIHHILTGDDLLVVWLYIAIAASGLSWTNASEFR